jgi:hypothetical protein
MSEYKCQYCCDTGYYGDNGPGVGWNEEFQRCDHCNVKPKTYHQLLATRVELAEARAELERLKNKCSRFARIWWKRKELHKAARAEIERLAEAVIEQHVQEDSDSGLSHYCDMCLQQTPIGFDGENHSHNCPVPLAREALRQQNDN